MEPAYTHACCLFLYLSVSLLSPSCLSGTLSLGPLIPCPSPSRCLLLYLLTIPPLSSPPLSLCPVSEYYLSRHQSGALSRPGVPDDSTLIIVSDDPGFASNVTEMTLFIMMLSFTQGRQVGGWMGRR